MARVKKKKDTVLNSKGRAKVIQFYDRQLATFLAKNKSNRGITRNRGTYVDYKGFYTGINKVTYLYVITAFPTDLVVDYKTSIRNACSSNTDLRINFIEDYEHNVIDWNSNRTKNRLRTWSNINSSVGNVDAYNMAENINEVKRNDYVQDSLVYLTEADKTRGVSMFRVRTLVYLQGIRGEKFDNSIRDFEEKCKRMNLTYFRVLYDISKFISTFSPFSSNREQAVITASANTSMLDEHIARLNTYNSGKLGLRDMYVGTEIKSKKVVLKVNKSSSDRAENWLISAETGSGKSTMLKVLLGQFIGNSAYLVTIMDIEGDEYFAWHELLLQDGVESSVIINMAEGSGSYYDPVEIVATGDAELDKDMFSLSKNFTLSELKILVGSCVETDDWVEVIIDKGVSEAYKQFGVTEEQDTWINSKGKTLHDIYNVIKELETENTPKAIAKDLVVSKLGVYLEEGGAKSGIMRNRVTLVDIINAKLVICSFGMKGKSVKSVDAVQLSLMQSSAALISHLRSLFGKRKGKYSVKVWEEFQRWGKFPGSDATLGVALTGGRKLGDINVIITNVLKELLDDDVMGILDNITSYFIGGISNSDTRERLCLRYSVPELLPILDKIAIENKDVSAYSEGDITPETEYSHSFVVGLDMIKNAVVKIELPSYMYRTELFGTFVDRSLDVDNLEEV